MKPDLLRAITAQLGWSVAELGRRCGHGRGRASDWSSGRVAIPDEVANWLISYQRGIVALEKRLPPPPKTDRRCRPRWMKRRT